MTMDAFVAGSHRRRALEVDAVPGVGPHVDDIQLGRPQQRGNVTPSAPRSHERSEDTFRQLLTVALSVVPKVRLRIGVRVGIQVLLCAAEVGEANGGEVLFEDLPDVTGGKLFDHAERLVQS